MRTNNWKKIDSKFPVIIKPNNKSYRNWVNTIKKIIDKENKNSSR